MDFPLAAVRARFPALSLTDGGVPRTYLDAPGGTQVCVDAMDAMRAQMAAGTGNARGPFRTARATDALVADARAAVADLLGGAADEIAFGPNMTTLAFGAARALAKQWGPGDELVVTRLDHDANVAPWLEAAAERGMAVRWLDFDPATGRLRLDELPGLLSPRTRLVAVGGASNALGTVNDVGAAVRAVRAAGDALVFVDAVQWAAHALLDVATLGADLVAMSPYKLFGPHAGVLWCRRDLAERLAPGKVRPAPAAGARRFETGTPAFEALAGVAATVGYLQWLGAEVAPAAATRRDRLAAAFAAAEAHEARLGDRLLAGLAALPGLRLHGPPTMAGRLPTFGFTLAGHAPAAVAAWLAERNIFATAGHFYAVEAIARLGLAEAGGLVRVGLCHYHGPDDVDRLLAALRALVDG